MKCFYPYLYLAISFLILGCVGDLDRCLHRNHWELADEVDDWKLYLEGEQTVLTSTDGSTISIRCTSIDQGTRKNDHNPCRSDLNEFIRMAFILPDFNIQFEYEYSFTDYVTFIFMGDEYELNSKRGASIFIERGEIRGAEDYSLDGEHFDDIIIVELYNEEVLNRVYYTEQSGVVGIELEGELYVE